MSDDERVTLAHAVHRLKEMHGPRIAAHLLYHAALTLTKEADRAALAESEAEQKQA
jgi:hypothetical protein